MNSTIEPLGYSLNRGQQQQAKEIDILRNKVQFVLPISLTVFALMLWDILATFVRTLPRFPLPMELFNLFSFLLAIPVLFWIGQPYLQGLLRFIRYRTANMDTLIGIGTVSAFFYSTFVFFLPDLRTYLSLPEYTYFDVTIIVIGFITLGKFLELQAKTKTGETIKKLLELQAKQATVIRAGKEVVIPISEVIKGDELLVKPGEKIPVDGIIKTGYSSIDEAMINGESLPVDKKEGDQVIGGTINKQRSFTFTATKIGNETMLAQIIDMVKRAQGSKAPIEALTDRVSSVFVPVVLVIAVTSFAAWVLLGSSFTQGLLSFVSVLVIACPCALGLATPTAIIVGVGKAAQKGILIKNAESLQTLQTVSTVVFDKTGTITKGQPVVTDILPLTDNLKETSLLAAAASLEKFSTHPLAAAIVLKANEQKLELIPAKDIQETEGFGVTGRLNNSSITIRKGTEAEHKKRTDPYPGSARKNDCGD